MPTNLIMDIPISLEVRLRELLDADEVAEVKLKGQAKEALICTDRRVIILKTGFLTGSTFGTKLFQAPYRNISGVDVNFSFLFGVFEIMTGGNQYTKKSAWRLHGSDANASEAPNAIGLNSRDQADLFRKACSHILRRVEGCNNGAGAPTPSPPLSVADELRKLAELRKEGVLTPEEFEAQKHALIGGHHARDEASRADLAPTEDPPRDGGTLARIDVALQRALAERTSLVGRDGSAIRASFGRRTAPPR